MRPLYIFGTKYISVNMPAVWYPIPASGAGCGAPHMAGRPDVPTWYQRSNPTAVPAAL